MTFRSESQTIRNVAESIERSLTGRGEGGRVEEDLWPACRSCGVKRVDFDAAIDVLLTMRRVVQSYDRIYVGRRTQ